MYRDKILHGQNNSLASGKNGRKDANLLIAKKMVEGGNFNKLCVMLINCNQ
jgi:hypothetical protein